MDYCDLCKVENNGKSKIKVQRVWWGERGRTFKISILLNKVLEDLFLFLGKDPKTHEFSIRFALKDKIKKIKNTRNLTTVKIILPKEYNSAACYGPFEKDTIDFLFLETLVHDPSYSVAFGDAAIYCGHQDGESFQLERYKTF